MSSVTRKRVERNVIEHFVNVLQAYLRTTVNSGDDRIVFKRDHNAVHGYVDENDVKHDHRKREEIQLAVPSQVFSDRQSFHGSTSVCV